MNSGVDTSRHSSELGSFSKELHFNNNTLAQELFGSYHCNLARVEKLFGVSIHPRGNELTLLGDENDVRNANNVLGALYERLERGLEVTEDDVDAAVRMFGDFPQRVEGATISVRTRSRYITPRSNSQTTYLRAVDDHKLVFAEGPAGTGKTYLAVAKAVELLVDGSVDRIILSRPAVEAGEQLGFLPGDMREKVDPYLRPLYDALYDMLPAQQVIKRLENGEIEIAPLAFMRGRTLSNAFVILDEAQNTTPVQMKMFLTRLGENSRMVVTGDLSQVDLPRGVWSGLRDAIDTLSTVNGVAFVMFNTSDVIRHPLVTRIVKAYSVVESEKDTSIQYGPANRKKRKI